MFCCKSSQTQKLPPTHDALAKHIRRANYQTGIWKRALNQRSSAPSPHSHGWIVDGDTLSIDWMDLPPAPSALLELIVCSCSGYCNTGHCSCSRNDMPCTDACQCSLMCENHTLAPQLVGDEEDDAENELDG